MDSKAQDDARGLGRCHYCRRALRYRGGRWPSWDHRLPRSRGGGDGADNLVRACRRCNALKADRTEAEFRAAWPDMDRLPGGRHGPGPAKRTDLKKK